MNDELETESYKINTYPKNITMKTLYVYKVETNTTTGLLEKNLHWYAPVKTDEELIEQIIKFTRDGYYCQIVYF